MDTHTARQTHTHIHARWQSSMSSLSRRQQTIFDISTFINQNGNYGEAPTHTRTLTHTHMATCIQFTHVFVCATTVASVARSALCPGKSRQGDLTGQQIVAYFSAHVNKASAL